MSRRVLKLYTRLFTLRAPMFRGVPLALALVAGLAQPSLAEKQRSIPEPIAPPVDGALYDGFSRIVSNGNTIAAFHTDQTGRFTTTLKMTPGVFLLFPDCRGSAPCENLRFTDMKAANLPGPGKSAPAQAMKGAFRTLTIDTSGLTGLTYLQITGRVEADRSHSQPATLRIGPHGIVLIPGIAYTPPSSPKLGGEQNNNDTGGRGSNNY